MYRRRRTTLDLVLLSLGGIGLVAIIPSLWIWLLYSGAVGRTGVYAGAAGLSALSLCLGMAMIRMLDGGR